MRAAALIGSHSGEGKSMGSSLMLAKSRRLEFKKRRGAGQGQHTLNGKHTQNVKKELG